MEDKRTLIAFLLVGAIFLLMPYYYELVGIAPPEPEPVAVTEAREDSARAAQARARAVADSTRQTQRAAAAKASPQQAAPVRETSAPEATTMREERLVVLQSERQRLSFSTRGGALVGAELVQYERAHGGLVNLLPEGARGLLLTVVSETGRGERIDLSEAHFEPNRESLVVGPEGQETIVLRADLASGQAAEKRITLHGDGYGVDVAVRLIGFGAGQRAALHWEGGIALAERDAELDVQPMKALALMEESLFDLQVDEDDEPEIVEQDGDVAWVGVRNKYFAALLAPVAGGRHRFELRGAPLAYEPFREYEFALETRWDNVEGGEWPLLLYLGPLDLDEVAVYEREFSRAMDLGWPVIRQISKVLLHLFVALHQVVPNYGWVIVIFGVIVKILVYPLTHKSYESAAKMQEVQPKLMALREKYKNNNQKLSQETMKLYKEEGVNPIGGCLPMVLQMPIFFSLYQVFSSAIQLRQSEWILWISDLSLPDAIDIGGFELHVLPLLMSGAMFFQSKMTMKDPKQAALVYIMPVVMIFIMWNFSSGLVLYWTVFNVMQIGQQVLTNHLKSRKEAAPAASR